MHEAAAQLGVDIASWGHEAEEAALLNQDTAGHPALGRMGFELAGEVFAPAIVIDREIRDHFGKFLREDEGPFSNGAAEGSRKILDQDARQATPRRALVAIGCMSDPPLLAAFGRRKLR